MYSYLDAATVLAFSDEMQKIAGIGLVGKVKNLPGRINYKLNVADARRVNRQFGPSGLKDELSKIEKIYGPEYGARVAKDVANTPPPLINRILPNF